MIDCSLDGQMDEEIIHVRDQEQLDWNLPLLKESLSLSIERKKERTSD